MLLYINENGQLLNGNIQNVEKDNGECEYLDVTAHAHKYLAWNVQFLGNVTLRSMIKLVQSNGLLQQILVDHCVDKFIDLYNKYPVQKPDTIGRDVMYLKIYRDGEFDYYGNRLSVYPVPYLLGYVNEEGKPYAIGLDFHPVEELLDKPLVVDGEFTAQAECLLNSPVEQEDITLNMPNFTLIEILECVFSELYPNGEEGLVSISVDTKEIAPKEVFKFEDFSWFNDGPQKGVVFSKDFNGEKEMVYTLLDTLPNSVCVNKFLKKFFADTVQVKPGLEDCNAYEFRVRVYGESSSLLPSEKMQQKKQEGKALRKNKFIFNEDFLNLWQEFNFGVRPESMYSCIKQ